jgi:peptide/nickel transport system substrate-binding protein
MKKFLLGALLILSLSGCGDKETIAEKTRMVVPIKVSFGSIAPNADISGSTKEVIRNMNQGLLKFDVEEKKIVPALAQEMKIDENGRSYTFILRDGIKFHNGKMITPEDVKYSFERVSGLSGKNVLEPVLKNILESVEIVDNKTVKINLKEETKNSSIIYDIADVFIVPNNITEEELEKKPVGAGPYKFVEYFPGEKIILESFKDYYLGEPEVKEVEFKIYGEGSGRVLAFKNGEIDFLPLTVENKEEISKNPDIQIIKNLANDTNILYLKNTNPKFSDKRVRQAIWQGIDMDRIIKTLTLGSGAKEGSHMSPYLTEFYQENLENNYPYNPEKAKELLKEAGYENNLKFTLTTISENPIENDMALFIKEDLAKVGVEVEVIPIPWGQYLPEVYRAHKYDAAILRVMGYVDPFKILKRYRTNDSANVGEYSNQKVDELIKQAYSTYNPEERANIYKEVQKILNEDVAAVYMFDQGYDIALSPKFTGYKNYPFAYIDISTIKVKK